MILFFIITIPVLAAATSLVVKKNLTALGSITLAASLLELAAGIAAVVSVIKNGTYSFNGYLAVDALGAIILIILSLVGTMASWYSIGYLKMEMEKKIIGPNRVRQYFILLHLFILAMFFAITTTNPILMWIAVEATTLSTAFLVSFYNKPSAIEAAWKYLIINSVGLLLAFFGTLLFLYPTIHSGLPGLISWQNLLLNAKSLDPAIAKFAFIFVLIGFGTKVGLAPMHTWLPDAHSKAPAPISGLLSGVLLNIAFLAILRFKAVTDSAIGSAFSGNLFIFFGSLSIIAAAFIILIQKNYKRLLAYSSIEHMGVAALGFGFGGAAAAAALLHMLYHSLAKSTMFFSAGNIFLKYGSTKIKNVRGLLTVLPVTGVLFIVGFLALTGVPPFGIFVTEFSILSIGLQVHPVAAILALLGFVLVFVGFLKHLSAMSFGENETPIVPGENGFLTIAPIIILVVALIVLSLFVPTAIRSLLQAAVINY